jgi:hypothetical protein
MAIFENFRLRTNLRFVEDNNKRDKNDYFAALIMFMQGGYARRDCHCSECEKLQGFGEL